MTEQKKPSSTPDDVRRDLSSLWQSALGQIDEIRDVIVRGSQAGKAKLDAQFLKRQRDKLLVQIGEAVIEDHKRGVPLPPGCEAHAKKLAEVDRELLEAEHDATKAFSQASSKSSSKNDRVDTGDTGDKDTGPQR